VTTTGRGRLVVVALGLCCSTACASRPPAPASPPAGATARAAAPDTAPSEVPRGATTLTPADAAIAAAFEQRFAAADASALWAVRLVRLEARTTESNAVTAGGGESAGLRPAVVLASRNADRLVLPASNMKIVTLAAAATRLGWDYRFRTELHTTGTRDGHTVRGDLVVIGGADPTIGRGDDPLATFRDWARQLRTQGVQRIDGDLIGDPSRFGEEWLGDSWSWDDLPAGYAAPYSGLIFNENVVRIRVTPGASEGAPAVVTASPVAYGLHLNPVARTSVAGQPSTMRVSRGLGSSVIDITGTMPIGAAPVDRVVSVSDPARYFLGALRAALAEAGIDVRGRTRVAGTSDVSGTRVLVHESAPLSDVARRFMKVSQNLYGEVLLRVATGTSPGASPAAARASLQDALTAIGVPTGSVQGLDGSGLSRRDFVTARAITTLLLAMAHPPHREAFRATLPIAGRDGTIATGFKGSPCVDRLVAKTGTLSHARALSGYITSASGAEYVFSIIANNFLVPTREIDAIVEGALGLVCAS
jgi:D-alanyl-D-alanine carboxypeptidase/D-alanyl-D-alanine-endopeptidase (penicillin-binding protein 4)